MKRVIFPVLFVAMVFTACKDNKTTKEADNTEPVDSVTTGMKEKKSRESTVAVTENNSETYFKGVGTEPFWSIEFSGKMIKFTSLTEAHKEFTVPATEPVRAADANIKMYKAEVESGAMNVQISQGECSDNMSDKVYGYKVKVEIKKGNETDYTVYEGCGNYITDYRLHDIWVLEKLGEVEATAGMFAKELPNMEINAGENKFFGYAGCNNMRGRIFFEQGLLRFTDVVTTEMACMGDNKEGDFLKALQSSVKYKIENNSLYLFNDTGTQLVFKKVD
ncbi:META domain-containing protein [Zhouia spongiae]|uniref:META domain-containing protein n=1 Tax=Zhouia spongiae TaxID=2202721 RepID=A0ABY3YKK6_9FLAO|nr:META domain-containing protein [Zhouia spongiae]UNY98369.1 META domain-containing protein [Zhouia spongiae]